MWYVFMNLKMQTSFQILNGYYSTSTSFNVTFFKYTIRIREIAV